MNPKRALRLWVAMALVGAMGVIGLAGCSQSGAASEGSTGGVAATVNGTEIAEDTITNYIQSFRTAQGTAEDDAWGQWLSTYGYTPQSVREEIINFYADRLLIEKAAEENEVTVTDEEVEEQVSSMKSNYSDEDAWKDALAQAGTTEEDYRSNVRASMLEKKLQDKIAAESDNTVSDEELLEQVKSYASYFSGAKKSSHILFNSEDTETAQRVLDQINNGEVTFEDAVAEYSQDEGSKAKGGDVGWDLLNTFVTEYTEGLGSLEEGQVSGLITSEYGIHIIKCTEVYNAPEEVTSLDQVPTELVEYIRTMANDSKASSNWTEWLDKYRESADIVINDMPSGLPYDIDMTPYQTSSEPSSDASSVASSDGATVEVTTEESSAADASSGAATAAEGDAAAEGADAAAAEGATEATSSAQGAAA